MSRVSSAGLMGAAQGFLQGVLIQHQQDQEDIRSEELRKAKLQEQAALEQMKAQYQSQINYEKVMLEFAKNSELEKQKQGFDSEQKRLDRASEEKRSSISAGATLAAAKTRAESDGKPPQRGEQIWQLTDGTNVLVKPDQAPPTKGQLIWTNGGSVGARMRGGTPGAGSTLNGFGDVPTVDGSAGVTTPPPVTAQPGASQSNPLDATSTTTQPPAGTWVRLPSGRVMQMPGA